MSAKIHALVDALGHPTAFTLSGGQAHDLIGADQLWPGREADLLIADKAFDADERVITIPPSISPPAQSGSIDHTP